MSLDARSLSQVFCYAGHSAVHLFTTFYFVIVLSLEVDWQLPFHQLIELWTLGALLVGLVALPAGWISDRWSAPGMMVVYFLGMGAAAFICGLAEQTTAMFLGLSAIGFFASIYHPVGVAWLVRISVKRGRALGINGIFGSLGVASSGLLAGLLIDNFGWRAAFIVPGIISLAIGVFLWISVQRGWVMENRVIAETDASYGRSAVLRVYLILLVTIGALGLIFHATQTAMPKTFDLRIRDLVGEGATGIGSIFSLVYLVAAFAQVFGGYLADRYALKPIYCMGILLQVPILFFVASSGGIPLIVLFVIAAILSNVPSPAENLLIARYTPQRHHSLAFGAKFVVSFGIGPVALLLVSAIEEHTGNFYWLYILLACAALLGTILALALPGERASSKVTGRDQFAEGGS